MKIKYIFKLFFGVGIMMAGSNAYAAYNCYSSVTVGDLYSPVAIYASPKINHGSGHSRKECKNNAREHLNDLWWGPVHTHALEVCAGGAETVLVRALWDRSWRGTMTAPKLARFVLINC